MRDLYVEKGLEGLQVIWLGDFQALEQFLDGVFPANIFNRSLRTEGSITSQNQNRARGIESRQETDHSIVFRGRLIRRRAQECFRLVGPRMHVHDSQGPFSRPGIEALENG